MTDHIAVLEGLLADAGEPDLRMSTDEKDAIRAAIALMRGQSWQPIETAPTDVEVWLFDPETDPKQYAAMLVEREDDEGGHYWRPAESLVADFLDYELTPTHWQPLPAPPKDTAACSE